MYTVEQIKTAMTKAKLSYWQMDVLLTSLGKLQKPEPQQLLQQTSCTMQLPIGVVELLAEVRQRVLVDLDEDGEPRSSMAELMAMWDKVNEALNLKTIGQLQDL